MKPLKPVVILGGGLCGLAAGSVLGKEATILEQSDIYGGLVRSYNIGDYWFDWVIHLLHFPNAAIEETILGIMGDVLAPCPPDAWIETAYGNAKFPIQHNLVDLDLSIAKQCIDDLRAEEKNDDGSQPKNYREFLLRTFGKTFCNLFFFPYNQKLWKRPLSTLSPSGFQWNISRPVVSLDRSHRTLNAYNKNGWYPRPPAKAKKRGMGLLSDALAQDCEDLRLNHTIQSINPSRQCLTIQQCGETHDVFYPGRLLSTIPLNICIALCTNVPEPLKQACKELKFNRVRSVALCIEGPRPKNTGLWRYYTNENYIFTRLVFMTEFDTLMAPEDGWSLLVETTERGEDTRIDDDQLVSRVWRDMNECGILPKGSSLKAADVLEAEPGYVVFEPGVDKTVLAAHQFLNSQGIECLGRYGNWEYSSMSKVMSDGFDWANKYLNLHR